MYLFPLTLVVYIIINTDNWQVSGIPKPKDRLPEKHVTLWWRIWWFEDPVTTYLLVRWFWTSRWVMTISGDRTDTPLWLGPWETYTHISRRCTPPWWWHKEHRPKILNYRRLYVDRPDPIVFLSLLKPLDVSTSGHLYPDFVRLTEYWIIYDTEEYGYSEGLDG